MSGPNGAGHPTSNGHKPPPVTPLRGDPDPISTSPDEPPRDTGSEQALLGALLIANAAYPRVAGVLRTTHFALPVHQRIYAAMGILIERGEEANPVTLGRYFEQDQALAPAGGAGYLMKLAQCAVTVSNALDYARTIVDLAHAREAMFAAQDLIAAVCNPTPDASAADHIARMRAQLEDIIVNDASDLQPVSPTEWIGRPTPQREWIVNEWIPLRRVTGLYGAPGVGKSLLMQMLCTVTALVDMLWLGLPVRHCRSVLFYCEDDEDEMHYRQEQINRLYRCTNADLGDMLLLPMLGRDGTLMTFDRDGRGAVTLLFYKLQAIVKRHRAQLVVLDTLSDVFSGNEINRSHARQFVQQGAARMARDCNCATVCCAHPSLTGISTKTGLSGSTGWDGAFRSRLYVHPLDVEPDEVADTDERVLTRKKANWAKAGEAIEMRWHDGVFVHKTKPTGWICRDHADQVFLELLDQMSKTSRWVSPNVGARNYAPLVFSQRSKDDREGFRKQDFAEAMERLLRGPKPAIVVEQYGRPSEPHQRLVRSC